MTNESHQSVTILGVGPFGQRVAALLAATVDASRVRSAADVEQAFADPTGLVVVAQWRPSPVLCAEADLASFSYRRPWLPIIMEHPVLRVGPMVVPSYGPCFGCYRRRCKQHDSQRQATAALHAAYADDPHCGPGGYLPQHARLATTVAAELWHRLRLGRPDAVTVAGEVVTIGLMGPQIHVNRVTGMPDCVRCGTVVRDPASPQLASLIRSIAVMKANGSPGGS